MGSQEKCTTLVGNICKKVGTYCSGIDNIISQESLQYAETQFLTAGANVKQFTENQFLTAGANVKQFTENQFLTAGANVKQFCSEFMQEVLPEFLKDSLLEKTQSEDTEKRDSSSCETLKKDDDEGHKDELLKSNSCDGISAFGFSTVGKEMSLEQNHINGTLIPSDIPQVEASEKNDVGMTPSICGVDQSHDGGVEDQIDLQSLKSVLGQPSYSSAKAGGTAEPEDSKVDSLTVHHYAIVSARIGECKILEKEVSSSGIALSKALNDSTETCSEFVEEDIVAFSVLDGPGDGKADQTKDNHTSETGMSSTEPFDMLTRDHDCPMLSSNKICSASDFQVEDPTLKAMENFPLKGKFEKGWEFIQTAGYEDHHVASDQPRGKSLKQSLQPREPKSINDHESCESDWEIV